MTDTELDEIRAEFSALARKALQVAEAAARFQRQRAHTHAAQRASSEARQRIARRPDTGAEQPTAKEVLAARWAAAEALRDLDPDAADAWSAAMTEAGVDVDEIRRASPDPSGPHDRFADYVQADRFAEHVGDCVGDAVAEAARNSIDWGDGADPGDWSTWGRRQDASADPGDSSTSGRRQDAHSTIGTAMARAATTADPTDTATDLAAAAAPVEAGRVAAAGRDAEAGL